MGCYTAALRPLLGNLLTLRADDLALLCVVVLLCVGKWFPSRFRAYAHRRNKPLADTRRAVHISILRCHVKACCACTHYLVFKEPEIRFELRVTASAPSASPPSGRFRPF